MLLLIILLRVLLRLLLRLLLRVLCITLLFDIAQIVEHEENHHKDYAGCEDVAS